MEDILFKGKRMKDDQRLEGSLVLTEAVSEEAFIVDSACYTFDQWDWMDLFQVYPDSVCQYTGETDSDNKRMWEKDIYSVKGTYREWTCWIDFHDGTFWLINIETGTELMPLHELLEGSYETHKLGNVYDNPDYLYRSKVND